MKRVLVLAYYFPPLGGAGVQRTVKLLKHLPDLGYGAIVVTGPEDASVEWAPPDTTLIEDVPQSMSVRRIHRPPPATSRRGARIRRLLGRPSGAEAWWRREALATGRRVVHGVDLIYASLSPFGSASVAAQLAGEAGIPWVADLRDPWALDEWTMYPTGLHRRVEQARMRSALRSAAAIVMNTEEAAKALLASFPEFTAKTVVVIPNGWDRDDFSRAPEPRNDGAFRIVYAGYSHVEAGLRHQRRRFVRRVLGGSATEIDPLARSHVLLVTALERLAVSEPKLAARVELHLAGAQPTNVVRLASERVVHHGYLPHTQVIDLLGSADLLFLAMHDLPAGVRARTVVGKTYEYLATGRPILAALPDGDARDLLAPLPNVWLCRPMDIDCMAAAVREAMLLATDGGTAGDELLERFERRAIAIDVARVFDAVLGDHDRDPQPARQG